MAHGNQIIVSANPKGVFLEGIIDGTPKPGTCMQIKAATAPVNGKFTWEAFNQSQDGVEALVAVLLDNPEQGQIATVAAVSGEIRKLYCPAAGETLNMLKGDVGGTGDDFAIGDRLMIDDGTGKVIADSSGDSVPFVCLETVTDPTADQLVWCMYTGH